MDNKVIAVIDIGSNSVRIQVSKIIDRTYKIINEYKTVLRLGDGIYKTGILTDDAIDKLVSELLKMKKILESEKVELYRAVATASFRDSKNGQEAASFIKERTGINIEIISGEEEARLLFLAASYYIHMLEDNILFIDMGGGSTEFSYAEKGELKFSISTPLGCARLSHDFLPKEVKPSKENLSKLKTYMQNYLQDILSDLNVTKIVCSGGSLNNISLIYSKRHHESDSVVKFVDSIFSKHFHSEIISKNFKERLKISGIEQARADIIVPASLLINTLIKKFNTEGFYTLSGGLRSGLTIDLMNKLGIELIFQGEDTDIHYARLLETGKKYYFDEYHATHVSMLTLKIFNQVKDYLDLEDKDWHMLEAAAVLHDIGQYISYPKHHKHSYYLIKNTELLGFSDKEINIIANIARYHNKALPKQSHDNALHLSLSDYNKMVKLAGILRAANSLDRTHSGLVKDINITILDKMVNVSLIYDGDISLELEGFMRKKDLLEKVLKKEVVLNEV